MNITHPNVFFTFFLICKSGGVNLDLYVRLFTIFLWFKVCMTCYSRKGITIVLQYTYLFY